MTRPLAVLDLYIVGNEITDAVFNPVVSAEVAVSVDGQRPAWDDSTMCIQIIHDRLAAQRREGGFVLEISCMATEGMEPLPKRPLDLGVGRWRPR